ncbi:DNA gyrase inhibitor YacG [Rhodovibrionaceae bacterium A322]
MAEILPFPKRPAQGPKGAAATETAGDERDASAETSDTLASATDEKCPICRKATQKKYSPFCSARCWQVDLGRWLNGSYRVETEERPMEGQSTEPEEDERW